MLLPEVERLHAEVLLLTGQIDAAQAILRVEAAAAHAKRQGALALEWRATMALARLYPGGRHDEARELLRRNYAAFTEGFTRLSGREAVVGWDELTATHPTQGLPF